jgi:hypothetical protein
MKLFFTEQNLAMPEQNLCRSIVMRAVRDAFSKNKYHRWDAWSWFHSNSRDYREICDFAGISPEYLRKTMLETIFLNYLIKKGGFIMNKGTNTQLNFELPNTGLKQRKSKARLAEMFEITRQAKSIFRAIYSQQELDKAIGSLTLNDIIKICKQSRYELEEEAVQEANNG